MASKSMGRFVLAALLATHVMADADELLGKAMSKAFMPAGGVGTRPASPTVANVGLAVAATMPLAPEVDVLRTISELQEANKDMKMRYQRLRAQIEKMPQVEAKDAQYGFGGLAGLIASVGLAASLGAAAVSKYFGREQQASQPRTDSQISLIPQRSGAVSMTASLDAPEEKPAEPLEPLDELKQLASELNPVIGYWDPLKLAEWDFWAEGDAATIGWLRHAEIKHGRVAMAGFIGYIVSEAGIRWPFRLAADMPMSDFEGLGAAEVWDKMPQAAKWQIMLFVGFLEIWSEWNYALEADGTKHYMRGGKPGYMPSFKKNPFFPLDLYDPFKNNKNKSEEWKKDMLLRELNNGRLAMFGTLGLCAEAHTPGSVPALSGLVKEYGGEVMNPLDFGPAFY